MFITRYKGCLGITLLRIGKFKAELWIIPPLFKIDEHLHPNQDIKIIYLWGEAIFYRNNRNIDEYKSFSVSRETIFKTFNVRAYHSHWFDNFYHRLVFINLEFWKIKPTSAAVDIKYYAKELQKT